METFNEDPKPGRLVLPLVLIGMIATTYTFINRVSTNNNLEIEPVVEDVVEAVEDEPEEETTTTTTTTLPDEVITYLEEISSEKIQSIDLATKVLETIDGIMRKLLIKKQKMSSQTLLRMQNSLLLLSPNLALLQHLLD